MGFTIFTRFVGGNTHRRDLHCFLKLFTGKSGIYITEHGAVHHCSRRQDTAVIFCNARYSLERIARVYGQKIAIELICVHILCFGGDIEDGGVRKLRSACLAEIAAQLIC